MLVYLCWFYLLVLCFLFFVLAMFLSWTSSIVISPNILNISTLIQNSAPPILIITTSYALRIFVILLLLPSSSIIIRLAAPDVLYCSSISGDGMRVRSLLFDNEFSAIPAFSLSWQCLLWSRKLLLAANLILLLSFMKNRYPTMFL